MQPRLARIMVFPFKSLDGLVVDSADVLPRGGLCEDRRFALRDAEGKCVNAKRTARIHLLQLNYDPAERVVTVGERGQSTRAHFQIDRDRQRVQDWLSDFFGQPIVLDEDALGGFPDDPDAPGPTLISTATLEAVRSWFPGMTLQEARLRFRTNLEIDGVDGFWEDRLYGPAGTVVPFRIGGVVLAGTNPCQRCVVPSRSTTSGELTAEFQKRFAQQRREMLPPWAEPSRFNHYYRLAVNTRLVRAEGPICVGDELTILGPPEA